MTVQVTPQAAADPGNRPPRAVQKERKQRETAARREILAPVRRTLTIASVIMTVASVCQVVPFVVVVELCRELLRDPVDTSRVWQLLGIAVLVLVLHALLQAGAMTWTHLTDARYQHTVRRALAAKLTRVPLGWFGERSSGEVKKFLQDDVEALHYLVAHARLEFVGALTVPLVTLIYLVTVDWRLALVLLLPLLAYAIALSRMMDQRSRDRLVVQNRWEQRVREATIEFVDGIQVVRAFGQAGRAHAAYQHSVEEQTRALDRFKTPMIRMQSAADITVAPVFVMLLIVVAGLLGLHRSWFEPLDILPFLLVGLGLGSSLMGLGYTGQTLREAGAAALRLHELQQLPELEQNSGAAAEPAGVASGTVRFESVGFGYRADRRVLNGVSFELAPGTITALVGPSGSGKSTLAKLLPRFYDLAEGRITIGGRDIRDYDTAELYRTVGFVFQDVRLIRGTVRDNLVLARPDADDAAVEQAARAARIHDRIMALPRGYESEIGGDAVLSGGEAQRLSIARALLADTEVLVLDEATAFADPESEAAVQSALAALVAGRTVLVIAHRLHTITGVDQILVLKDGVVVERGTHDRLRGAGGEYRRLWDINEDALGALAPAATGEAR